VTILTFLDECEDREGSRSFALTALLVPAEQYQAIRTAFYERLNWLIVPNPGQVRLAPPELHGVALLPEESDERKLEACRAVADLVTLHGLAVFRVGYRLDSPGAALFRGSEVPWLGLCWSGLLSILTRQYGSDLLVPVMDGQGDKITRQLSPPTQQMAVMRAAGLERSLSVANCQSVGETFYADSRYSVCTQMVDVVSYLRHANDWARLGLSLTPFKQRLVAVARRLDPAIGYEEIITLQRGGDAVSR